MTYADGSTVTVNVNIAQTTTGELFLVPHVAGQEALQAILDAAPIKSLTLDSVVDASSTMPVDRLASDTDSPVDGTSGDDTMGSGFVDADGDTIDGSDGNDDAVFGGAGDDSIDGSAGNDLVVGGAGNDDVSGGAGNDDLRGDTLDGSEIGNLQFENTDNVDDAAGVDSGGARAIELVTLSNGDLIMITSEQSGDEGIRSYQIDNDPASATYGQIIATNNAIDADVGAEEGYRSIEDMASVTTSGGDTYVFTADETNDTIGIAVIDASGNLSRVAALTDSTTLDTVQELSQITVGGTDYLLALAGGSSNNLVAYEINSDGTLTQTDRVVDGSGAGENFLDLSSIATNESMLESFTNAAGDSFVLTGGREDGISLWTLDGTGNLTFQNARVDNASGAGDTDPQGNDLARDLIAPSETGLDNPDSATFAEIEGETYVFIGDADDDITIFRLDADALADGTFDLTLVGMFENVATDVSAMTTLVSDAGTHIVLGGEDAGLKIMDVVVNADGTVDIVDNTDVPDDGAAELADSEDIKVADGILVSASDDDDGVAIVTTGLRAGRSGDDTLDGGAGNDVLYGGAGDDELSDSSGNDTMYGGDGSDSVSGQSGADSLYGGGGADTLFGGADDDLIYGDNGTGDGATVAFVPNGTRLRNGDFSDGLTGWVVNNPSGGSPPTESSGRVGFNGGNETTYGDSIQQSFDANVGQEYTLTLDLIEDFGGVASHTFRVDILDQDGTVIETITETVQDSTTQPVSLKFVPTSLTNAVVITNTVSSSSTTTDGIVDNVKIVETGPRPEVGAGDSIEGNGGNDTIFGQVGDDTISGDAGNDTIDGGLGNDTIDGGAENDSLLGGVGNDSIQGGSGNDQISGDFSGTPPGGSDFYYVTPAYVDGINFVVTEATEDGSPEAPQINIAGDALIVRFTDDDVDMDGDGSVNEVADDLDQTVLVNGVEYNYSLDYRLSYTDGTNTYQFAMLDLDLNDDGLMNGDVDGGNNHIMIQITGPAIPADTDLTLVSGSLTGGSSLDYSDFADLSAADLDDSIDGGGGDDTIQGNQGDDTLAGGTGNDTITGGDGNDTFAQTRFGGDDVITDFDTADDDSDGFYNDQLDVSGLQNLDGSPIKASDVVVDDDGSGNARLTFPEGETIVLLGVTPAQMDSGPELNAAGVPCFTSGTLIATPQGQTPVEQLRVGDLVITIEHGVQPICWAAHAAVGDGQQVLPRNVMPVRIKPGMLGNDIPLVVSPQHCVLMRDRINAVNVYVRTKHLAEETTLASYAPRRRRITYHHILLEHHATLHSNGVPSESFYPGPSALDMLSLPARASLYRHVPLLARLPVVKAYGPRAADVLGRAAVRRAFSKGALVGGLVPPAVWEQSSNWARASAS